MIMRWATLPWITGVVFLIALVLQPVPGKSLEECVSSPVGKMPAAVGQLDEELEKAGEKERVVLRISRGELYRTAGRHGAAADDFRQALNEARETGEQVLEVIAAQNLGYVRFLQGEPEEAESLLRRALNKAEELKIPGLKGACANRLALVLSGRGRREEAYTLFHSALEYAGEADEPVLTAAVRRNLAGITADKNRSLVQLKKAYQATAGVESPRERLGLLLGIGVEAGREVYGEQGVGLAYETLSKALSLAPELGDARSISQAAGYLGALYERRNRLPDSYRLTAVALEAAQGLRAHDLLLRWEWQLGRILHARGDQEKAIAAYRRAVYHIQTIRQDIPVTYQDGRSSFRETLSPIYLGLADLLLRQSATVEAESRQELLREARKVVESFKRSELTDYFRDPCIAARRKGVEDLVPGTVVIYPVIFPDRLELLVNVGNGLHRATVPVKREILERNVGSLVGRLRRGEKFKDLSQEVHEWLIRPLIPILEKNRAETLVYVPDGILRLLPLSSLWDGESFVAEKYATVTVSGLTLLDPAPLARGEMYSLMAGMSEPGSVVFDLPEKLWQTLRSIEPSRVERGIRGFSVETENLSEKGESPGPGEADSQEVDRVKRVLALPGVGEEIGRLAQELPGKVMLNEDFKLGSFRSELGGKSSYRVLHIASHGYFGGTPEQNFIMTYDERLDMNQLSALIRNAQRSSQPLELVTLSACQTAEGDDRSPLGLSGVVLKSGARSALGSLWPVSDKAAQNLLPLFYVKLKEQGLTKAEALRKAQMVLLQEDEYSHPFYWAPFILVGNWL